MKPGWERMKATQAFSEPRIGDAKPGDVFVCQVGIGQKLVHEGKAVFLNNTDRRPPPEVTAPPKKPDPVPVQEPESTPAQTHDGPDRPWPFSGAVRRSQRRKSSKRGDSEG